MVVTTEQATISMIALKYVAAKWRAVSCGEIGGGEGGRYNLKLAAIQTFNIC